MNLLRLILLFSLGFCLNAHGVDRSAEDLFFEGNARFAEEAYADAVALYEKAIDAHPSPNLHYNLGNAFYHLEQFGQARLHWEKTLAMAPQHAGARTNLDRLLTELNLPRPDSTFGLGVARMLSYNQWIWLAVLSLWTILFSLLGRQWKKSSWLTLLSGLGACGVLVACGAILLLAPHRSEAIVLAEASLRVAPAPQSPVTTTVRPAERVRVADRHGDFLLVHRPDGQEGYLPADELGRIW